MAVDKTRSTARPEPTQINRKRLTYMVPALGALALMNAFFAGLRTLSDPDLLWQMATGRWIVQHRSIPFTDVFSYTVPGKEWIYPVLSQTLFYLTYAVGGYRLLSWLGAAVCIATVAVLIRSGRTPVLFLAILAVPLIAEGTTPRAEMFTELLFATFVSILWEYHRSGRGRLWILPILMCLWVNLHPGFIAGLGMCAAYVFLELGDGMFGNGWAEPIKRLRRAAPWLTATVVCTLLNPWGVRIYTALVRQSQIDRIQRHWVTFWLPIRLTPSALGAAFDWRNIQSTVLWLIAASIVAFVSALAMRRIAAALLLGCSIYMAIHAIRYQAPFATIAVVIAGSILADAATEIAWVRRAWSRTERWAPVAVLCVCTLLVSLRVYDLASNQFYFRTNLASYFGAGEAPVFPEKGAAFLLQQRPPGNVFNDFNSGGFVTWALPPTYTDYIDGRAVPFGPELHFKNLNLLKAPLDSDSWTAEADRWGINTILVSVDRKVGAGALSALKANCASQQWRPVYLDTEAAVFVRLRPETADLINRFPVDCDSVRFENPPETNGSRGRAEQFDYYLNAAAILVSLGRHSEALAAAEHAEKLFGESAAAHYVKGVSLWRLGDTSSAEQELRKAADLQSMDASSMLARLYESKGQYANEVAVLERAASLSLTPYQFYLRLGFAQLAAGNPPQALAAFDKAEVWNPYVDDAYDAEGGAAFRQQIAEGRSRAQRRSP